MAANDNETVRVNEGRQVSSKSPLLAKSVEAVISKETGETGFASLVKNWRLTSGLDSDQTWLWVEEELVLDCRWVWACARQAVRRRNVLLHSKQAYVGSTGALGFPSPT